MFRRFFTSFWGRASIAFLHRYERHIGVGALLFGFLFDTLTLGRPDQLFGAITLSAYLVVSAGIILFLSLFERRQAGTPALLLVFLQFVFGNLAGGLLVLYGQSGTFEGSFLFFLLFGAFIIGNEFLRSHYNRLTFHIGAWFFLLLAYAVLFVPIVAQRVGDSIFLLSVAMSSVSAVGFLFLLFILSPRSFAGVKKNISITLVSTALFFIALYYGNIIPPVPLSLQQIGVFHTIAHGADGYAVSFEKPLWYSFFRLTSTTYTLGTTHHAYCFSSVFVPRGITTSLTHRFERLDEGTGEWSTITLIQFPIHGGREAGFRGYSETSQLVEGKWRCSVETNRGALIGRTTFTVVAGQPSLLRQTL